MDQTLKSLLDNLLLLKSENKWNEINKSLPVIFDYLEENPIPMPCKGQFQFVDQWARDYYQWMNKNFKWESLRFKLKYVCQYLLYLCGHQEYKRFGFSLDLS